MDELSFNEKRAALKEAGVEIPRNATGDVVDKLYIGNFEVDAEVTESVPTVDKEVLTEKPLEDTPVSTERLEEENVTQVTAQVPAVENVLNTEKTGRSRENEVRKFWKSQRQVPVFVPLAIGEKPDSPLAYIPVTVNGNRIEVPKGRQVEVPEDVAKIIYEHLRSTQQAGQEFKINRDINLQNVLDK